MMNKNNSFKIIILLILNISFINAGAVKSTANNGTAATKSLDIVSSGAVGIQNESKRALIGEDPLATQNYNDIERDMDFSTYKKITLKKVILETLAASNTLKAANEKLIQSKVAYSEAATGYLPTVDFSFDTKVDKRYAIIQDELGIRESKVIHDQRYKFTINQPIYSGGTTELKVKNLEAKYKEAKNKYRIVLNQTIQSAIKAYFTLLFDIEKVEITIENMEKLKKILDISQVKYDSGAISVGDLAAIKAGVANAETKLNGTKSKLADSIDYYLYLLNNKFEKTKPFQKNFTINVGTLDDLKNKIIKNNLPLINFRLNVLATKYKLKSFKYNMKPKVDLQMKMVHILNQEDYTDDEQLYSAKVSFRYNIYNKGTDLNSIVKIYSSIEELEYRYQDEIKKISWDTSKLYNSIKSLTKSLKSTQDEIKASIEMVDIYWEGFQLGEQDLQILLQGQRQLNTAKITLLRFKKDYLTNMFKVLSQTNELASFFNINYQDQYFIDFTEVEDQETVVQMDTSINKQLEELNTSKGSYLELIQEYTFDDIVSFKDSFLEQDDEKYTILISDFANNYDAYGYIKLNRLMSNSFAFDYFKDDGTLQKNTLDKKVAVSTKVAHGIYDSQDEANNDIENNFDINVKNFKVVKVEDIKDMYTQYVDGLTTLIDPYIIKPIKKKRFQTDANFKKNFLNANKEFFTINIVSLSSMSKAQRLLLNNDIEHDSFVFRYGRNGKWVKVVYGIFETYSQALEALNAQQNLISKYHPIIEKISHKQDLYYKYEEFNKKIYIKTHALIPSKQEIKKELKIISKNNKKEEAKKLKAEKLKAEKEAKKIEQESQKVTKQDTELSKEIEDNISIDNKVPSLNNDFKTRFINANPQTYYTANMALFTNEQSANKFVQSNNIKNNSIIIPFSKNGKSYYKIMYGLFKNKEEAIQSINNLPKNLALNKPTIEGVKRKQVLLSTGDVELSKKAYLNNNPVINTKDKEETIIKEVIENNQTINKVEEKELNNVVENNQTKDIVHDNNQTTIMTEEKIQIQDVVQDNNETSQMIQSNIPDKITNEQNNTSTQITQESVLQNNTNKDNSDFISKFNNASGDDFTIRIAYVTPERLDIFINEFVLDNNFIVHKYLDNFRISSGIYKTKDEATNAIKNLHVKRVSKAKVIQIKSIR